MSGTGVGVPRSVVPGDMAPTPGSSGAVGPEVSGLYLPGSPDLPPPLINWRRVGDKAEFACLWVATTKRLLHVMLVSVDQNILHLIWVSLKERGKSCPCATSFLHLP
jgi:hypothetical protein